MFKDRKLVIATKHKKELVIAPVFESAFGLKCFVPEDFDTDQFGTFSSEIERKLDAFSTLRQKCLLAMELTNCDLGIASEGSFGADPNVYFAVANEELMIFIDKKNYLEIVVREVSSATNFNAKEIKNLRDLLEFASKVNFPSHGIILRRSKDDIFDLIKGIHEEEKLIQAYSELFEKHGSVYAETDMRAMHNPMRMAVIERACIKLKEKIESLCPSCKMPGYSVSDYSTGLECSLCYMPTQSVKSLIYSCLHCNFSSEILYPNNKTHEDPNYCNYCNP